MVRLRQIEMEQNEQRGFALPVAVFALVVVGVITTGGFFMARQEGRIGVANENTSLALYLTEQGLVDVMGNWPSTLFGALPVWGDTTFTRDYADIGSVTTRITRMTNFLYFVDADGTVTRGGPLRSGASRRIGVTVRLTAAAITPPAALVTRGPTDLRGTAEVHGEDEVPTGWGGVCTGPLVDKPGIISDDASQVATRGQAEITGSPAVTEDPSIADSTFNQFGELTWDDLTDMADITLSGGTINNTAPDSTAAGECRTGQAFPGNWGNPENPGASCFDWYPIIHITSSANIQSGGVGQGILLVDGDLDLRGSFAFYGIVITQGQFGTQGSGNRVFGGVMAGNADFDSQSLVGGSVVTNSTCAVSRAVLNSPALTRVRPLVSRSWVDLSATSES
jgi:hypothetical protein